VCTQLPLAENEQKTEARCVLANGTGAAEGGPLTDPVSRRKKKLKIKDQPLGTTPLTGGKMGGEYL